jgi:diguanylate cyclase (GGDEF)-like protein
VLLDLTTLLIIAIGVAWLLGIALLVASIHETAPALAWWGAAYLIGGASGALWRFVPLDAYPFLSELGTVLLLAAVGMMWTGARIFHGRSIPRMAMFAGAALWLVAYFAPGWLFSPTWRLLASALVVAVYTFLTAAELWRERRKPLIRGWPAILVPVLHGSVFLLPATLAGVSPAGGVNDTAGCWIAVYAVDVVLYVVGTAFLALVLAQNRRTRLYKAAAATDPLTGLFNRRGFYEAAALVVAGNARRRTPVSILAFDLDHFKSINDRFGHATGDVVLQTFASVVRGSMRGDDIVGRLGGEEFVALVPGAAADAAAVAERVRSAIAATRIAHDEKEIAATVSVGVASAAATVAIDVLLARADAALYSAKAQGRNRVCAAAEDGLVPGRESDGSSDAVTTTKAKRTGAALAAPVTGIA